MPSCETPKFQPKPDSGISSDLVQFSSAINREAWINPESGGPTGSGATNH